MNEFERYTSQPSADTLQQPRNDLQSGAASTDQMATGSVQQSMLGTSQEQLNTNALRVGESTVTVPNTTTTSSHSTASPADAGGILWWIILLPLLVIIAWYAFKGRPEEESESDTGWQEPQESEPILNDDADESEELKPQPSQQTTVTKAATKKHHVAKKKRKSKKR